MDVRHQISLKIIDAIDKMVDDGIISEEDSLDTRAQIIDGVCLSLCSLLATAGVTRDTALLYFNEMIVNCTNLKRLSESNNVYKKRCCCQGGEFH